MDRIFNWCVNLLEIIAEKLNLTYEQINVIIFVIIIPIIILALIIALIIKW